MERSRPSGLLASSEPVLGELIEATRTRLQAIELGREATQASERKDVEKILFSIRLEVEKFLGFMEESWDKANSGVKFAKDAETLVKALLKPTNLQSDESVQRYILELQAISKNAYDETDRTAKMFVGGIGAIYSILDDISEAVESIESEQEDLQDAKMKAERRAENWGQKANRFSPENGTSSPIQYLFSPFTLVARSKQLANTARINAHELQYARSEKAIVTLQLAKDKTDGLTRTVTIVADYWSKMSAVLKEISDRVASLQHDSRHDGSLLGKLRTLAPDLFQANMDFNLHKKELETLRSYLQASAFETPGDIVEVPTSFQPDASTPDARASPSQPIIQKQEPFTSPDNSPSASPSTSNTSHSLSDPSRTSTEGEATDQSSRPRPPVPATNGTAVSTSSGRSNISQDSNTRTSEANSNKLKSNGSNASETVPSSSTQDVKRTVGRSRSTTTSTRSNPAKVPSESTVQTGELDASGRDDSKAESIENSRLNDVSTTISPTGAKSKGSKSSPPVVKPKPSTMSASPPQRSSTAPTSNPSQPSASHSTSDIATIPSSHSNTSQDPNTLASEASSTNQKVDGSNAHERAFSSSTSNVKGSYLRHNQTEMHRPSPPIKPPSDFASAPPPVAPSAPPLATSPPAATQDSGMLEGMIGKVAIVLRNRKAGDSDEMNLFEGEYIHQITPYPYDKKWWIGVAASDKSRAGAFPVERVRVVQDPLVQQNQPPVTPSEPASSSTSSPSSNSSTPAPRSLDLEEPNQPTVIQLGHLVDERLQNPMVPSFHEMPISQEPDYMEAMMELASQYENEGHCSAGAIIGEEILRVQVTGPRSVRADIIWAMQYLSKIYLKRGEYRKAGLMMEKLLRHSIKLKGKDHPDTLQARENLAANCELQSRYSEAEFIWTGLITISRNKNGGMDKESLRLMERLADMYEQGATFESATTLRQFVFNVRRQTLGLVHQDTQYAMKSLAVNLEARELWREAVMYWKALSKSLERTDGVRNEEVIHVAACLENARTMYPSFR